MRPRRQLLSALALLAASVAHPQQPSTEHIWQAPLHTPEAVMPFGPDGIVILKGNLVIAETAQRNGDGLLNGRYVTTVTTRNLIAIQTGEAALRFPLPVERFDASSRVATYDARILRGGKELHIDASAFEVTWHEYGHAHGGYHAVEYKGIPLRSGDLVEVVSAIAGNGRPRYIERPVRGPYPIAEQNLYLLSHRLSPFPLRAWTYGFPDPTIDSTRESIVRHWRFNDLPASRPGPFQARNTVGPFYSIGSFEHFSDASLAYSFQRQYPYVTFSPRKNYQAFTKHIEARKAALKGAGPVEIIQDIVRFVHDSLAMVDDEAMPAATPIGVHFHGRTISHQQLVVLYRQLFSVLRIPLHACYARDRYLADLSDTLHAEHVTDMVLAFQGPAGDWHYIAPNSTGARYLLDEIPYWLAGQEAIVFRIGEGNANDGPFNRMRLPKRRHTDNVISEQVLVELSGDMRSAKAVGRGVCIGMPRLAKNTTTLTHGHPRIDLRHPATKWQPLAADSLVWHGGGKEHYRFTKDLPAISMIDLHPDGSRTIDLSDLADRVIFGKDPSAGSPFSLLPYPHTQRQDIIIRFDDDVQLQPKTAKRVRNTVGEVLIEATQPAPRMILLHVEQTIVNTYLDPALYTMYDELLRALGDRANLAVVIN